MPYKEGKKWRGVVTLNGKRTTRLYDTRKAAVQWEIDERAERLREKKPGMDLLTLCNEYLDHVQSAYISKTYSEKSNICKRLISCWGPNREVETITPSRLLKNFSYNVS